MAPLSEIIRSLYGALHLARGDTSGMAFFNATEQGFWRSFTAAILIAPLFALLLTIRYHVNEAGVSLLRFTAIETIAYVVSWVAFPLLLFHLTDILGIGHRFIRYIVAYNWASVLQNLLYLPFALLVEAHLVQGAGSTFFGIILLGLVLLYTWFVTRTALEVTNLLAAGLVMIDLVLSIFINTITQGMLRVQ
ncbi:MAG: hypothetical protein QF503_03890 [Rhodospirillales bacterium]|jgi:hypothetical protein|nr:hypothetical protein [Rhodospirillales bacterium]|tara:strand:- start:101 stop:676 length:576 start_codon:yes stop_codon:yes gene_type:complete